METAGEEIDEFRLDRAQFSVACLIEERLRALELLRRTFYGYTNSNSVEYLLIPAKQAKAVGAASP